MSTRAPSPKRTSSMEAYRSVLRFIGDKGLAMGDKLPSHADLGRRLHICHGTLDIAMKWLVSDGVLVRKRNAGTTLLTPYPEAPRRSIWKIGIVMPTLQSSYFFPVLAQYLHKHLERLGATDRTYMLSNFATPGPEINERQLRDYTGLEDDISDGFLHGILTADWLTPGKIPVCGVASWERVPMGARLDYRHFILRACEELYREGFKNLCVVTTNPPQNGYESVEEAVRDAASFSRGSAKPPRLMICPSGVSHGTVFCDRILALPRAERPQALVFQNDLTTLGFTTRLVLQPDYRPAISAQTNLQVPLAYPVPVNEFRIDVDLLARAAVEILVHHLSHRKDVQPIAAIRSAKATPSSFPPSPAPFGS